MMNGGRKMKRLKVVAILLCMTVIAGCFMPAAKSQARTAKQKKAKAAYTRMMKYSSVKKFATVDVNGDGIKELVTWKTDGSEAPQDIFTYYKGKVIRLNTACGNANYVYYDRVKKCIICDNSGTAEIYWRYKVVNGHVKKLQNYEVRFRVEGDTSSGLIYVAYNISTGKLQEMTKRKFSSEKRRWKKIKPHKNTKKNRNKYL